MRGMGETLAHHQVHAQVVQESAPASHAPQARDEAGHQGTKHAAAWQSAHGVHAGTWADVVQGQCYIHDEACAHEVDHARVVLDVLGLVHVLSQAWRWLGRCHDALASSAGCHQALALKPPCARHMN